MGDKLQICHPEFISGSKRELNVGGYVETQNIASLRSNVEGILLNLAL